MKPGKAKPLRMWMVKRSDGQFCFMVPQRTKADAIAATRLTAAEWRQAHFEGCRAVRVTVTEDTNGR